MTDRPSDRRVLIVGADGLRPDMLDPAVMPTVATLAAGGVRFTDFHSVYPPHTRAAIASLTTGCHPGRHGLLANAMHVPDATEDGVVDSFDWRHLDALDRSPNGPTLLVPALDELLAAHGARVAVAGTGSSGATLLWSRTHRHRVISPHTAYGRADLYALREKLGPVPDRAASTSPAWADYATRAVIELFLPDAANRVVVLWLDELDDAQHRFGLGSPEARAAMATIDGALAAVLEALDRKGVRERFDVLFLSDHGHTTVLAHRTLGEMLDEARRVLGRHLPPLASAGDFVYAAPGAPEPTASDLAPLMAWAGEQPWCDLVLAGRPDLARLPGVVPLARLWAGAATSRAPLLSVAPRWDDGVNGFGVPGRVAALGAQPALRSSHGSLAPADLHAVLIAHGPSFREGISSPLPAGVVDVLPTVLALFGIADPGGTDGRILGEGLRAAIAVSAPDGARDELVWPTVDAAASTAVQIHRVGISTYVNGSVRTGRGA